MWKGRRNLFAYAVFLSLFIIFAVVPSKLLLPTTSSGMIPTVFTSDNSTIFGSNHITTTHSYYNNFFRDNNEDESVMICGISAMFGNYEKTAKEPLMPLVPSFPLFLVTDQEHLLQPNSTTATTTSAWTRIRVNSSLWQEDCRNKSYIGARNNPCEQPFLFNHAKFYKMQFYRVPEIIEAGCNVVIWLDATIQIKTGTFMGQMAERARRGQNFVVYVQDGPRKTWHGSIKAEVGRSKYGKYGGKSPESFGPAQNVEDQYTHYLSHGFTEKWFQNASWYEENKELIQMNGQKYGLYITCMVMFDLRKSETKTFLDCWWNENILRSTQDQIGFPYCAWKHNILVHSLPDTEEPMRWDPWDQKSDSNPYFRKLDHGL